MKAQILSFHCVLRNKLGQVLSSSFNQDVINQLETGPQAGQRLSGLVASLQDVHPGEKRHFTVSAGEAYGHYDPSLVLRIARSDLPSGEEAIVGTEVIVRPAPGKPECVYRVTQIEGRMLVLDGNHPLAGQDLVFDIEVVTARDARSDDFEEPIIADGGRYLH